MEEACLQKHLHVTRHIGFDILENGKFPLGALDLCLKR
jgi:hypothetical protein